MFHVPRTPDDPDRDVSARLRKRILYDFNFCAAEIAIDATLHRPFSGGKTITFEPWEYGVREWGN